MSLQEMWVSCWRPSGTKADVWGAWLKLDDDAPEFGQTELIEGFRLLFWLKPEAVYGHGATLRVRFTDGTEQSVRVTLGPDVNVDFEALFARQGRRGAVRLSGRCLVDDDGPFLATGTSLFWAFWGEKNDPDRLELNLSWLAARGVDFIRMLGMVGTPSWADRVIDPYAPDYWDVANRLITRCKRHGIRLMVTVFADAQVMMPDQAQREAFALAWGQRMAQEPEMFLLAEVCNEHDKNGIENAADLKRLGQIIAAVTDVLLALSATAATNTCAIYDRDDSPADAATVHFDRSRPGTDNHYNAIRQPWGWPGEYGDCDKPVGANTEPIGIDSSGEDDPDPRRLAIAMVTTFVSQCCIYVLHTGAGIRGGGAADMARGRQANVYDQPTLDQALAGIAALRALLPADLPNWTKRNAQSSGHPFKGFDDAVDDGTLVRSYAAVGGGRAVVAMLGIEQAIAATARWAMTVDVVDPIDGALLETRVLAQDQALRLVPRPGLQPHGDGLVLVCRW